MVITTGIVQGKHIGTLFNDHAFTGIENRTLLFYKIAIYLLCSKLGVYKMPLKGHNDMLFSYRVNFQVFI